MEVYQAKTAAKEQQLAQAGPDSDEEAEPEVVEQKEEAATPAATGSNGAPAGGGGDQGGVVLTSETFNIGEDGQVYFLAEKNDTVSCCCCCCKCAFITNIHKARQGPQCCNMCALLTAFLYILLIDPLF